MYISIHIEIYSLESINPKQIHVIEDLRHFPYLTCPLVKGERLGATRIFPATVVTVIMRAK